MPHQPTTTQTQIPDMTFLLHEQSALRNSLSISQNSSYLSTHSHLDAPSMADALCLSHDELSGPISLVAIRGSGSPTTEMACFESASFRRNHDSFMIGNFSRFF